MACRRYGWPPRCPRARLLHSLGLANPQSSGRGVKPAVITLLLIFVLAWRDLGLMIFRSDVVGHRATWAVDEERAQEACFDGLHPRWLDRTSDRTLTDWTANITM